ncbi:hypothetical protein LTR53_002946 [Teratosphaeriaceae sp. CCFEE 6253]|nr:hypothetical protein LTR53_002946 [Teratosphaeriaceae sp. CCFEE 6253]
MATSNDRTTFGASIHPSSPYQHDALLPPRHLDSPVLTPATSHDDIGSEYHDRPAPPHSPFYTHPPASFERIHSRQNSKTGIVYEKDLEGAHNTLTPLAGGGSNDANPFTSKVSVEHSKECAMWPSKQTLLQEKAAERQRRHSRKGPVGCAPAREKWARMSRKQKLGMKLVLAFVIVGAVVGIAVGISVAVHGTYYSRHGQQNIGET